jgi:hypothetical protein
VAVDGEALMADTVDDISVPQDSSAVAVGLRRRAVLHGKDGLCAQGRLLQWRLKRGGAAGVAAVEEWRTPARRPYSGHGWGESWWASQGAAREHSSAAWLLRCRWV